MFFIVAIPLEGKSCQWLRLNLSFLVLIKISSKSEGNKVSTVQTVKEGGFKESYNTQSRNILIIITVLSFLLILLYLAGNIIFYTPDQGTKREKYIIQSIYQKERMPTLAGNIHLSVHFLPHGPRPFHLSTEKRTVRSVGSGHQSGYSRADIINKNINKWSKVFPYKE